MIDDDFFEEKGITGFGTPKFKLRKDLLNSLRAGPLPSDGDLTFAIVLTRLVRSEFEAFGTGGGERLSDPELELAQRTLRGSYTGIGIDLSLPWRNFTGFKTYWLQNDAYGSWQARRDLIARFFDPVQDELDRQEEAEFHTVLAEAVPLVPRPVGPG